MALMDAFWGNLAMVGHGAAYALQLIQIVTGEPPTNAAAFVLFLYLAVLRGI